MKNINFGQAIEYLKKGYPCRRSGWNGKGMSIIMKKGSVDFNNSELKHKDYIESIHHSLFESGDVGTVTKIPTIILTTPTKANVIGWHPSLNDIFSEDWEVID